MIKKLLLATAAVLVLVMAAAVAIPFLFKDKLFALVEEQANNHVNATVSIGDLDLTFFEHFPELTLVLNEVQIVGKAPFDGLELAYIKEFSVSVDLLALLSGSAIEIQGIYLADPRIHVLVLEDGVANYDIAMPDTSATAAEADTATSSGGFSLALKRYAIANATVIYDDRQGKQYAHLVGLNHGGNGDFTASSFLLETHTEVQKFSYSMEGIPYLNGVEFESDFDLLMDLDKMRFEFGDNSVRLNALQLAFSGWLAMPDEAEEPLDLDFTFSTPQTDFKSILSLVPAVYSADFDEVETEGKLTLQGFAKGRMVGDLLPAFDLKLEVAEARFKYPDLPEAAENIAINLHVSNTGGSDDNTVVDLSRFHLELAKNPVDATLYLTTPVSDPNISASLNTNLDLASLAAVVPLQDGQRLSGKVDANLRMAGRQSAIDAGRYDEFSASGTLGLSGIEYADPSLPYTTIIESCRLEFAPQVVSLTDFAMQMGRSDVQLSGRINNLLNWYASGAELDGDFNFSSSLLDLNEFITEETEAAEGDAASAEEVEESSGVVEVPAGYRFTLNTRIAKVMYENLEITNLEGNCAIADKKLSMSGLGMNMLDGHLIMAGHYETSNPAAPSYSYSMDATNWDCEATYKYLDLAAKLAPLMEHASGSYSLAMSLNGHLDANMEPILNTLSGGGVLTSSSIGLNQPAALSQAASLLKFNGLDKTELSDIELAFEIKNGRVEVDPLEFIMAKEIPSVFSGAHSLVGELDYDLNLDIPTKALGSSAAINNLMGAAGAKLGADVAVPERIKADLKIGGTSLKPVVSLGKLKMGEAGMKEAVNAEIDKQKEALESEARAKVDEAKAEAETRARAEAEKAKADAAARAKKAEEEAKAKASAAAKAKEEEAKKRAEEEKKKAAEAAKKKLGGMLK